MEFSQDSRPLGLLGAIVTAQALVDRINGARVYNFATILAQAKY